MRGHLITSQYKVTAAVLSSLGGCLVRTATQSNDGRSGGGGDRVLAPSLNRGLSLICRSVRGHWPLVPTRRCEPRPRHRAPGEAAHCPTAHCYICRLSSTAALKCRGETARLPWLPTCFYPFGHFHSRFANAIHLCIVMVLLEMKYS